ncbi:MAG: hypothetical protein DWQ01_18725 [Planctomycetota bacterium]|nr:MAG: hypothetical protein DWQ01_18725 [Planctomycetota bacterium]
MAWFRVIAVVLWSLWMQGPRPNLPAPLDKNQEVVAAYAEGMRSTDLAVRKVAAQRILNALAEAQPEAQAEFLLRWEGLEEIPVATAPAWRRIDSKWADLRMYLHNILKDRMASSRPRLLGALKAVGHLEMAAHANVEVVAAFLDDQLYHDPARRALYSLTRRDFRSLDAFLQWWNGGAKDLRRIDWVLNAAESERRRVIAQWDRQLKQNPSLAFEAVRQDLFEVRSLGYLALRSLPALPADAEAAKAEKLRRSQALQQAWAQEASPELRRLLVPLIPRFFEGAEAMAILDQALASPLPELNLEAARTLQLVKPVGVARTGVLSHLGRVYESAGLLNTGAGYRAAMFTALVAVTEGNGTANADPALDKILSLALASETDPAVRSKVYSAIGSRGGPEFMSGLREHVANPKGERSLQDQLAAMQALTRLAVRQKDGADFIEVFRMHLASEIFDLRLQAVQSLTQLRLPQTGPLLAERLAVEQEGRLVREILVAIGALPNSSGLDFLLSYVPPREDREIRVAYQQAVARQLAADKEPAGMDPAKFMKAMPALAKNQVWDVAFALVAEISQLEIADEGQYAQIDRFYTLALAQWLLEGGLHNGGATRADEAAARLKERMAAEPAAADWPWLLARLENVRRRPAEALAAAQAAAPLLKERPGDLWPMVLESLALARDANLPQQGLALLQSAGQPQEPFLAAATDMKAALQGLLPPPPEEPKTPPETAPAPAPQPEPASTEGGQKDGGAEGAETPAPAKAAEQPGDKPVPADKPAEKPEEKPAEKPADPPTDQPTEPPVEQPTEQPSEQPVETPEEEPTAEPPASEPPAEDQG